jgi:erythromycin esterase-like protein
VLAADNWDESPKVKTVRPGMADSYERLFHEAGGDFWLGLQVGDRARELLLPQGELLERAIGVIHRPETERHSHYFYTTLPDQFDAVIHLDRTRALTPLDPPEPMPGPEVPETYPTAV